MSDYLDPTTWRQKTSGGIPFRLISRSGSFDEEGASAKEVYLIEADQLLNFSLEMFPAPVFIGAFGLAPLPAVLSPGTVPLFAERVSWKAHISGLPIDPFGADSDAPTDTYQDIIEVTVDYGTRERNDDNELDENDPKTFLRVTGRAAGEFLHSALPEGKTSTATASDEGAEEEVKEPNAPITIIVPETEWTVEWPRVPRQFFDDTLVDKLRNSLGFVNSSAMGLLHNAPPETILFVGYDFDEEYTWRSNTQPPVRLSMKFLEKYVTDKDNKVRGHNSGWKANKGWQRLFINDDNDPPYDSKDLNDLWTP